MSLSRLRNGLAILALAAFAGACDPTINTGRFDATVEVVDLAEAPDLAVGCAAGIDTDGDGLANADECARGTDPLRPDSDGDGVSDGKEVGYPKGCVATNPTQQKRPPTRCTNPADCPGGTCVGLDPTKPDSDGDGVPDGLEDGNLDGKIEAEIGETDPRLGDSDGDGISDGKGGLDICRPAGLAGVTQMPVPGGPTQLGHDPAWGTSVTVVGQGAKGAVLVDDAAARVAGAVLAMPSSGDVRAEQMRIETTISTAIGMGVTPVLVGSALTTHEMQPAITSTYRVARANTSAAVLRDLIINPLVGAPAPGGKTTGAGNEFVLDVTTVRRTSGTGTGRTDVIVTIAPTVDFNDTARATAIRAGDLVNTTAVAESGKGLGSRCQVFRAQQSSIADFLWTVDTSGSMGDDQARLGTTATQFFQKLTQAGVDFRVAVIQAGSTTLNIDTPGLKFINGTDPNGAQRLCEEVTSASLGKCPTSPNETLSPYTFTGGQEEPTAAAVIAYDMLDRRAKMGETNPDRRFRDGAKVVTFHVTDEPGSNDFSRYFTRSSDPQTNTLWGTTYNAQSLGNIIQFFKRNDVLTYGLVPVRTTACSALDVYDLPRCVIEGNGGAVIPIATATQPEIDAAMAKIVLAVAGATSQFALSRSPITSTIKVKVAGKEVPRSRASGFDYDPARRAIIFFGTQWRPKKGDEVVISYRVWEGSVG